MKYYSYLPLTGALALHFIRWHL